jgi:2,3-bisphosphoglycerate-dependent phosphoglycerate mutase
MMRCLLLASSLLIFSCKTTTYYISRHAEKGGTMSADPPLTPLGQKQAIDLQAYLANKKISAIYSTNFVRTRETAQPTSEFFHLPVHLYNASQSTALADSLKTQNRRNVLIIGHSNTVDDLVNEFMGKHVVDDLPDSEYGSLLIVQKKGSKYRFHKVVLPRISR